MSHICGTVEMPAAPVLIGPDSGAAPDSANTWIHNFSFPVSGTRFVILHFMNVSLPASNRLEVDLGYDTDVFTASDGGAFWTRPINIHQLPGSTIPIRYITSGAANGGAAVDRFGRGQRQASVEASHNSITNCDPFLPDGWIEPLFPHVPGSTAPKYDPFWICNKTQPPRWQHARCAASGTIQREVSRSVGMIVTVHPPGGGHPHESVSTCSVTLIDSDLVALAAHCISSHGFEVPSSSVTFDYEVACDGSVVIPHNAVFYKVRRLVKFRFSEGRDYAILQLRGAPPLTPVPVLNGVPAVGESVFGVHHPNGAVKKISPSGAGSTSVLNTGDMINVNLDVAGGSSGSGLFDLSGRLLGVLSNGGPCSVNYSSAALMLNDPVVTPDPPDERAVMLVLDRSGSMTEAAAGGGTKMDEVREAASLFISMMRTSMGNAAGLVTFATDASSPPESPIAPYTAAVRDQLLAELPDVVPYGMTSIGDGLAAARNQLNTTSGLPRSILLMTDGMENAAQSIADVSGLGNIEITAIGFGTESNLDGPRLTELAQRHGGFYKRAGSGLELRKFFALAFGDIFEAGTLADPEFHLSAKLNAGAPFPFHVCGEEAVTVVAGWDNRDAYLSLHITTPGGQVINMGAAPVQFQSGNTWCFARIPLPHLGERNGVWHAQVVRPGGGEFPPPAVATNYFINVIARGGPSLRPYAQPRRLYTGDILNPRVIFQYADETVPTDGSATLRVRRPDASVGTALAQYGLGTAIMAGGDSLPARQATVKQMEADTGAPVTHYVNEDHLLTTDSHATGSIHPAGIFGVKLEHALVVDGTYTFHAKARIEGACTLTRETQWSHHVHVGIDPEHTPVVITPAVDGTVTVTFRPQDRYGNLVGPGAANEFEVFPLEPSTLVGPVRDLGDGRYAQTVSADPLDATPPGIVICQPDREPAVLTPPERERIIYRYTLQLHCGTQVECCGGCESLLPGRYATSVCIFNGSPHPTRLRQQIIPTHHAGVTLARWPEHAAVKVQQATELPPMEATVIDCCVLSQALLGGNSVNPPPVSAIVLLESAQPLQVTATYVLKSAEGQAISMDVERIAADQQVIREKVDRPRTSIPMRRLPSRTTPPPRPQDVVRTCRENDREKARAATDKSAGAGKKDKKASNPPHH